MQLKEVLEILFSYLDSELICNQSLLKIKDIFLSFLEEINQPFYLIVNESSFDNKNVKGILEFFNEDKKRKLK